MALSGSNNVNLVSGTRFQMRVRWTATQNIDNNTSVITAKGYVWVQYAVYGGPRTGTVVFGGETIPVNYTLATMANQEERLIFDITRTIEHNSEGKLTVPINFTGNIDINYAGAYVATATNNQNAVLNDIPRASTITTFNPFTIGSNIPWAVDRKHAAYTHKVELLIGSKVIVTASDETGASGTLGVNQTAKEVMLNLVPNSVTITATLRVTTYSGTTQIGSSQTATATATVGADIVPNASITSITDGNTSSWAKFGQFMRTKSTFAIVTSSSGVYGSSITARTITANGQSFSTANATTNNLTTAGSNAITLEVTDSRGRKRTVTVARTVYDYKVPTAAISSLYRCNSNGTENDEGTYVRFALAGTIDAVGNLNNRSHVLRYKASDASAWSTYAISTTVYNINGAWILSGFDINKSYDVVYRVTDFYGFVDSTASEVPTAYSIMDFHSSGRGMTFGGIAEGQGYRFKGALGVDGQITQNGGLTVLDTSNLAAQLLSKVYPVGAIYMSVTNTSPASFLGGTWVAWGAGRVPVGVDSSQAEFNTVQKTGGANTHFLTVAQMPSHTHTEEIRRATGDFSNGATGLYPQGGTGVATTYGTSRVGNATGGGGAHNNLQPYITCYMWRRTA